METVGNQEQTASVPLSASPNTTNERGLCPSKSSPIFQRHLHRPTYYGDRFSCTRQSDIEVSRISHLLKIRNYDVIVFKPFDQ